MTSVLVGTLVALAVAQMAPSASFGASRVVPPLLAMAPYGYPKYSAGVTDYVVRCDGVNPVRVEVTAPAGTRVAVDGRASRSGRFTTDVQVKPGQGFTVAVQAPRARRSHTVRCLPTDFPQWSVARRPSGSQQWYVMGLSTLGAGLSPYAVIFDRFGTPVWWLRAGALPIDVKLLGQSVAFSRSEPPHFFNISPTSEYEIRRLDGSLVRTVRGLQSPIDSHELVMRGANFVYLTYRQRLGVDLSPWGGPASATVFDAVIEEVTPDGALVWSWNSRTIPSRSTNTRFLVSDRPRLGRAPSRRWCGIRHRSLNSVDVRGDFVLLSLRHADAVYKIRRSTGQIVWKLGGTRTSRSLSVRNDVFGVYPLGGQHDARMLADGSVTVYDNAIVRAHTPRAVRYVVEERRRIATLVEEVTASIPYPSICCGSARKLGNGGWLIAWGGLPAIDEYDAVGQLVFSIGLAPFTTYRVQGVPFGRLSRAAVVAGMNAMHPR